MSVRSAVAIIGVLLLACCANPTAGEDTGIRGQVLRGPLSPGPEREGVQNEAPFSALFHVLNASEVEVGEFRSDEEGRFQIALEPGDYTIVPDASAPIMNPARQRRRATVPEDEYAEVVLRYDTGLR